jgi:hypothetical protein
MISIEGGNTFHTQFPFQVGFSARFENASVHYSTNDPENIIVTTDTEIKKVSAGEGNDGFLSEMNYFLSCAEENKQPEKCTPESALESIKICYRHTNDF